MNKNIDENTTLIKNYEMLNKIKHKNIITNYPYNGIVNFKQIETSIKLFNNINKINNSRNNSRNRSRSRSKNRSRNRSRNKSNDDIKGGYNKKKILVITS